MDTNVSAKKIMIELIFEIDGNGIHIRIALIDQDKIVLLQIIVLVSEIRWLKTVIFLLVYYLVDIVIEDEYF